MSPVHRKNRMSRFLIWEKAINRSYVYYKIFVIRHIQVVGSITNYIIVSHSCKVKMRPPQYWGPMYLMTSIDHVLQNISTYKQHQLVMVWLPPPNILLRPAIYHKLIFTICILFKQYRQYIYTLFCKCCYKVCLVVIQQWGITGENKKATCGCVEKSNMCK